MRIELLHLDDALLHQHNFIDSATTLNFKQSDLREAGTRIRLWGYNKNLEVVKSSLTTSNESTLTFMGSGDFHHVTALLLERMAETKNEPFTVIHFDNHPDWVKFPGGMHCGSWVERATVIPQVNKIITLGVCSSDLQFPEFKRANLGLMKQGKIELFPFYHPSSYVWKQYGKGAGYKQRRLTILWNMIKNYKVANFCNILLSSIQTETVYITIDKDVLSDKEVITNWDQGRMALNDVTTMIRAIAEKKRIIGADVIGDYSPKIYSGSYWDTFKKRAESWLDQPHTRYNLESISWINSVSNTRFLNLFQEVTK